MSHTTNCDINIAKMLFENNNIHTAAAELCAYQLVLEHAEAPQKIDGVEQDAVRGARNGAVLHSYLYLRHPHLLQ